ncbi:MAG TPA: HWE histidine kinase domain-containing protein [Rhizomicrobium sp.]|nr:HWE histidine kinase domain-containing protein [Rhizomicrobium sp.]
MLALERIVRSPAMLVENLPTGIYTCDRDGLLVQFNRRAAELWGRTPSLGDTALRFSGAFKIADRAGKPVAPEDTPMAQVLATGHAVRDRELIIEQPDGRKLTILANVDPLFDEQGALVGGVNCFQDISELVEMKGRMREGRRVARRVMEALPVAIYTTDAEGKLLYFNKAAEQLWGFAPNIGDQYWCGSWKIYLPDGTLLPHDRCPMAVALREKRALVGPEAVVERPDGTRVPFLPYPTPIFDSEGTLIGGVNMLIDLSNQKRADAQQRGLIDELNHRVKNTLATIQSLAAQTMRGAPGEDAFQGRLLSLSRLHDQLSRNLWEWVDLDAIARDTFARLRAPVSGQVTIEGRSVHLQPRAALGIGMVLHELASNTVKHGALSSAAGSVELSWRNVDSRLFIDWREKGGPAAVAPKRRGFGTRLLERAIAHELGGKTTIEFSATGVHCTMEIPLPG